MNMVLNLVIGWAACIFMGLIASCHATPLQQPPASSPSVGVANVDQRNDRALSQTMPKRVIRVEPAVLDFGEIPTYDSKTARLKLTNIDTVAYKIIEPRGSHLYSMKFRRPTILQPGETIELEFSMSGGMKEGPILGKSITLLVEPHSRP